MRHKYFSVLLIMLMIAFFSCRHSADHVACCDQPKGSKYMWIEEVGIEEGVPIYKMEVTDTTFEGAPVYPAAYPCYNENYWAFNQSNIVFGKEKFNTDNELRFPHKPYYEKNAYGFYHTCKQPLYNCKNQLSPDTILQSIYLKPLRPGTYFADDSYPLEQNIPYRGKYAGTFSNREGLVDTIEIKNSNINMGWGSRNYRLHIFYPTIPRMESQLIENIGYKCFQIHMEGTGLYFMQQYNDSRGCAKYDDKSKTIEIYYELIEGHDTKIKVKFNGKKL